MNLATLCSGIGAPEVAAQSLGLKSVWQSEIDPYARKVLEYHLPDSRNLGDMTKILTNEEIKNFALRSNVDILAAGTPCQSFSIGGRRKGMDDERGKLALEYIRICEALSPKWIIWENVPNALRVEDGRAFSSITGALAEIGYGFAYRILDAKHFGVPQARRRIFLVGCRGDWRPPIAVLFERNSLQRYPKKSKKKEIQNPTLFDGNLIAASEFIESGFTADAGQDFSITRGICPTLKTRNHNALLGITLDNTGSNGMGIQKGKSYTLTTGGPGAVAGKGYVRRFTPRECARLQGFPDDWAKLEGISKTQQYKLYGNSIAVPVIERILQRLIWVNNLMKND